MRLEPVQLRFPFRAAIGDPGLSCLKCGGIELDRPNAALFRRPDEAAVFERFQMLHYGRQADRKRLRQLRNRSGSPAQSSEHPPSHRVGKSLKGPIESGRIVKHELKYQVAIASASQLSVDLTLLMYSPILSPRDGGSIDRSDACAHCRGTLRLRTSALPAHRFAVRGPRLSLQPLPARNRRCLCDQCACRKRQCRTGPGRN